MTTPLSHNFTLEELCKSQTASRRGIDNLPTAEEIDNLRRVAENILQPVRTHFDRAFTPSSGFRCLELNRAIGSGDQSQHVRGEAVDIEVPRVSNYDLAVWIRDTLEFDQLILECYMLGDPASGWVHVSLTAENNRNEALTYSNGSYQVGLVA